MASSRRPGGGERDRSTGTLGALLYADKSTTVVSEQDWRALLESIATGDQHALQALYRRTNRMVFTLIVRITNNRETAEELTLDVFHDVWRRASTYDAAGGTVVGWIMNQARSRAIDRWRFEQRKKRVNHDPASAPAETAASDLHEGMHVKEQSHLLRKAVAALAPHERQVIEIAYFSELTYAEVAARLNEPLGTVKTRIRSGLTKLRRTLISSGVKKS
jgi:RNA polymerase sigma-70 factor, ECF subfamily